MSKERTDENKLKEILEQDLIAKLSPSEILDLAAAKYLQEVEFWQNSLVGGGGLDNPTKEAFIEINQKMH